MKLSTIWTDFDEFLEICKFSGTLATRHKIKIIKTYFDELDKFEGNWNNLFQDIIDIFIADKRVSSKFDYDKAELEVIRFKLSLKNPGNYTLKKQLFDKLSSNVYNGVKFNSPNIYYSITETINLINNNFESKKCIITGNSLISDVNEFSIEVDGSKYQFTYSKLGEFSGNNKIILKYPEIDIYVKARYFKIYPENIIYPLFKRIVLTFSDLKIKVPSNSNGYLASNESLRTLHNYNEALNYFITVDKRIENFNGNYTMVRFNEIHINRAIDTSKLELISSLQNKYGDERAKFPLSPKSINR